MNPLRRSVLLVFALLFSVCVKIEAASWSGEVSSVNESGNSEPEAAIGEPQSIRGARRHYIDDDSYSSTQPPNDDYNHANDDNRYKHNDDKYHKHNHPTDDQYTSTSSSGKPVFNFGKPTYFGSGCPQNSVVVVTAAQAQTVSVIFSQYMASTSGNSLSVTKSCNLIVPVSVQKGHSVGIFQVDYRGSASIPNNSGSQAKFHAEYFFAGGQGPQMTRTYHKNYNSEVFISNKVQAEAWSPCGASTNFRINTFLTAQKDKKSNKDVSIGIDTTDLNVADDQYFKYYLKSRTC